MRLLFPVFLVALLLTLSAGFSGTAQAFNTNPKLAMQGYDTVAYFDIGNARMGSNAYTHEWDGATWFFASKRNMEQFKKNPKKFAPQYGGYCAWAAAQGYLAPGDPDVFYIKDGKLYLNFNREVQMKWFKDIPGNIKKANANWPKLSKKK